MDSTEQVDDRLRYKVRNATKLWLLLGVLSPALLIGMTATTDLAHLTQTEVVGLVSGYAGVNLLIFVLTANTLRNSGQQYGHTHPPADTSLFVGAFALWAVAAALFYIGGLVLVTTLDIAPKVAWFATALSVVQAISFGVICRLVGLPTRS